ncbi:MAG: IS4 family transposase [Bacteroidetes bacterium]|nr:IS4 family transposase [Bacteroidota bacterium]
MTAGSIIVFDKGYFSYDTYNRFTSEGVTWVTRQRERSVFKIKQRRPVNEYQKKLGIKSDWLIELGHDHKKNTTKVQARLIKYYDVSKKRHFVFTTNNVELAPLTIANYYQQRWQIETFFKRIKQNYPLQYFLGDNDNAIKIQIWCTLIADLLLKVLKNGTKSKMAFSNIVGFVRLHLMTYMDLKSFLRSPEKALVKQYQQQKQCIQSQSLFSP